MINHVRDLLELRQRWGYEACAHVDRAIAKLDLEFETGHGSYEEYLAALREVADAMVSEPILRLRPRLYVLLQVDYIGALGSGADLQPCFDEVERLILRLPEGAALVQAWNGQWPRYEAFAMERHVLADQYSGRSHLQSLEHLLHIARASPEAVPNDIAVLEYRREALKTKLDDVDAEAGQLAEGRVASEEERVAIVEGAVLGGDEFAA